MTRIVPRPAEPETATELVAALQSVHADSAQFVATLPTPVFFTAQGDKWSPADHVRHLGKSVAVVSRALRAGPMRIGLRFGLILRRGRSFAAMRSDYHKHLASGATAGSYTPPPLADDRPPETLRIEIMQRWNETVDRLIHLIPRWSDRALDFAALPHPVLGRLTVREVLMFTVHHNAHHISRVIERATPGLSPSRPG